MKNVLTPLAKRVWFPLGLSAGMSVAEPAIQKKIYWSGCSSLEESQLLMKGLSETIKNEGKKTIFPVLSGTLVASILGNALTGKYRQVKVFNAASSFN